MLGGLVTREVTQNYGMSYLEPRKMKDLARLPHPAHLLALLGLSVGLLTGCGSSTKWLSSLEDDELYLGRNEEFVTDAEYLAYAFEQAGYDAERGMDARSGDAFASDFGYVPQSLRGRSMLRGYMTPYGAAGFGPNPYDPWGSSFCGGFNPYSPYGSGLYDPFNPYGNVQGGYGASGWGMNPYMGNSWGYNPYASMGYNPYGYGGYGGFGTYGGWGGNPSYGGWTSYGNGGDVYTTGNVVVAPRTPIWTSSAINSNGGGGRLITNKVETETQGREPHEVSSRKTREPRTIWSSDAFQPSTPTRQPATTTRSAWGTPSPASTPSTRPNSTRSSGTRSTPSNPSRNAWSGSSPSRSTTAPSNNSRPSATGGSNTSRPAPTRSSSSGNSSRSTGRSGGRN